MKKKYAVMFIFVCILCVISAATIYGETLISKDGEYEYELEEQYTDTGKIKVATLTRYLGNSDIVYVPKKIDNYDVVRLSGTFKDCSASDIRCPDTIKEYSSCFYNCYNLIEGKLPVGAYKCDTPFYNCNSLKSIVVEGEVTNTHAVLFYDCPNLEMATFNGDINSIWVDDNCKKLESLYFNGNLYLNGYIGIVVNNSNIKKIVFKGSVFCPDFRRCENLESVSFTENSYIMDPGFEYCYNLKTINFDGSECKWKKVYTLSGGDIFRSGSKVWLENVKINFAKESDHKYGNEIVIEPATCQKTGIKEQVCEYCGDKITETIPISKTHSYGEWNITKEATFNSAGSQEHTCSVCGKKETKTIKKLVLKAGLIFEDPVSGCKYKVLGDKSRICCLAPLNKKVISIIIPDTLSYKGAKFKVTAIGNKAFSGCSDLVIVTLGKNISSIGSYAFSNCGMLCRIIVKSTGLTKVGAKALSGTDTDLVIRVPKKKLTAYKKLFDNKGQSKDTKIQGVA